MTRKAAAASIAVAIGLGAAAPAASAHGLAAKQDLPIPTWLFAWAATAVLVISFFALGSQWKTPKLQTLNERPLLKLPPLLEPLCGLIGIGVFAGLVYAGYAGSDIVTTNILPTALFVAFWVGIPVLSAFLGDIFRPFNPWRATGRAIGWASHRIAGEPLAAPIAYPARLGYWPAVIGIAAFVWLELIYDGRDQPSALATAALIYSAIQLTAMTLFGVDTWTDRGDALSVYFSKFASLAPLNWRSNQIFARLPLAGTPAIPTHAGIAALACTMIGTTSFDGLTQGTLWLSIAPDLQNGFVALGLSKKLALEAAQTAGLALMIAIIYAIYSVGIQGIHSLNPRLDKTKLSADFAHTLVPIALAYVIAHYIGLVAYQGQALAYLISDPLGQGSDIFGTASSTIDYSWISATGIWYIQVGALITGHVAGLALAHDRALTLFKDQKVAVKSQYWMLGVMVGFTSLGLWLLSAGNSA